jgi:hypothetical protein
MQLKEIPHPLTYTDPKGRRWCLYCADFESPDGVFSVYLYAISDEHAHLQLDAFKETGRMLGKVEGIETDK